jgi:hypothetical protein
MKASSGEDCVSETYGSSRDHGDTTTSDGGGPERFPGTSDQPDLDPHYCDGDICAHSGLVWRVLLARQTAGCASQPASPCTVTVCVPATRSHCPRPGHDHLSDIAGYARI